MRKKVYYGVLGTLAIFWSAVLMTGVTIEARIQHWGNGVVIFLCGLPGFILLNNIIIFQLFIRKPLWKRLIVSIGFSVVAFFCLFLFLGPRYGGQIDDYLNAFGGGIYLKMWLVVSAINAIQYLLLHFLSRPKSNQPTQSNESSSKL